MQTPKPWQIRLFRLLSLNAYTSCFYALTQCYMHEPKNIACIIITIIGMIITATITTAPNKKVFW